MPATEFSEVFETMKTGIVDLAKSTLKDYVSQATKDGKDALKKMKADLETWTHEVVAGQMTIDDLKFLIQGRKELTQMKALQQAGIAQVELDKFTSGVVDLIIGSISKLL